MAAYALGGGVFAVLGPQSFEHLPPRGQWGALPKRWPTAEPQDSASAEGLLRRYTEAYVVCALRLSGG